MKSLISVFLFYFVTCFSALSQEEINVLLKEESTVVVEEEVMPHELEQEPEFIGGNEALYKFMKENLSYPQIAIDSNIQGKVYVFFIVEKDGKVTNPIIKRGVHPSLDAEVLRLIAIMPNWKPGLVNNEPVRSRFILPVKFEFDSGK